MRQQLAAAQRLGKAGKKDSARLQAELSARNDEIEAMSPAPRPGAAVTLFGRPLADWLADAAQQERAVAWLQQWSQLAKLQQVKRVQEALAAEASLLQPMLNVWIRWVGQGALDRAMTGFFEALFARQQDGLLAAIKALESGRLDALTQPERLGPALSRALAAKATNLRELLGFAAQQAAARDSARYAMLLHPALSREALGPVLHGWLAFWLLINDPTALIAVLQRPGLTREDGHRMARIALDGLDHAVSMHGPGSAETSLLLKTFTTLFNRAADEAAAVYVAQPGSESIALPGAWQPTVEFLRTISGRGWALEFEVIRMAIRHLNRAVDARQPREVALTLFYDTLVPDDRAGFLAAERHAYHERVGRLRDALAGRTTWDAAEIALPVAWIDDLPAGAAVIQGRRDELIRRIQAGMKDERVLDAEAIESLLEGLHYLNSPTIRRTVDWLVAQTAGNEETARALMQLMAAVANSERLSTNVDVGQLL